MAAEQRPATLVGDDDDVEPLIGDGLAFVCGSPRVHCNSITAKCMIVKARVSFLMNAATSGCGSSRIVVTADDVDVAGVITCTDVRTLTASATNCIADSQSASDAENICFASVIVDAFIHSYNDVITLELSSLINIVVVDLHVINNRTYRIMTLK